MSDYFSTVRQGLADAAGRRAHLRWYRRLHVPHSRSLAVVLAALVVAAPALAAVSGWFSQGQPDSTGSPSPETLFGVVRPGHSRMLPIRVADPQGGPAWGLRLVRTTRGDTCVQLGRVQNGQLGSLGIADAWDNDHQFHPISPSASDAQDCGSTDAAGHGFVNRGVLGESASANLGGDWITGPQASGCRLPVRGGDPSRPLCPTGSNRIVFYGLLGPNAVSITYRKPGGGLATERTVGGVGAYLLVFPYNAATCAEYDRAGGSAISCDGESEGDASPVVPGAVTEVTFTGGRTCNLTQPARLEAAYRAFRRAAVATLGRPSIGPTNSGRTSGNAKWLAAYRRLLAGFLAREHLTLAQFQHELGPAGRQCPAVGWVALKATKVTAAEVASPIRVREFPVGVYGCPNKLRLPGGCDGVTARPSRQVPVEWSFNARLPVTHDHSWYEWSLQYPSGCAAGGESFATYSNIRAGQTLRYSTFLPATCHGTYQLTVGFMAQAPQGQTSANGGGGFPGHDSSIVVGRASLTIG
jgi:hypothetical protein